MSEVVKHSSYYIFMKWNIENEINTKEVLTTAVAKYAAKGKFYEGEADELLDLIEEHFPEDETAPVEE